MRQLIPDNIMELFGQEMFKYSIILFTHGDLLEEDPIEELIKENCVVRRVVDQCGGRFHVFNNKDLNNRQQVNDLLQKTDTMIEQNGGGCYSNEMFEDAKRFRREEEERIRREEEERRQRAREEWRQKQKVEEEKRKKVAINADVVRPKAHHLWRGLAAGLPISSSVGVESGGSLSSTSSLRSSDSPSALRPCSYTMAPSSLISTVARRSTSSTRLPRPYGSASVSRHPAIASGLHSSGCASSLRPSGSAGLLLPSSSASVLDRSGYAAALRISISASVAGATCSAVVLRILGVALDHRLSVSASGSTSTCSATVGRPHGVVSPSSTMAPPSVGSAVGHRHGWDLGFSGAESEEELRKYQYVLQKCESSLCAFLLVLRSDRLTQEDPEIVKMIEELLGEQRLNKIWILFTRGDELEYENKMINKVINESQFLKELNQKYEGRFHLFNNKKRGGSDQVKFLINKVFQNNI
ncbi:hypothetical protein QQF64_025716 [Cirrhinus molitorella]|uniref:AIG1-type G domain-containing protein n=1 Tax=Cirrhinus molitorella TaxID=172907 RepID=A0ABR3NPU8_9TELE